MILSGQTIRKLGIITPFNERTEITHAPGDRVTTFGVGPAGYDVRVEFIPGSENGLRLDAGKFYLASTIEHFTMPDNVIGIVHDKSSWARIGLAVQNTVIEPGWRGFLTLEISNHGTGGVYVGYKAGIAQIIFHYIDEPAEHPYNGKYQDQQRGPQLAR